MVQIDKAREINETTGLEIFHDRVKCLEGINHILVHNLRGVASNIKMLVDMLMKTYVRKDEQPAGRVFSLEQGLSFIEESSSSLMNTLSNLMKGIDAGRNSDIKIEQCDIAQVIRDTSLQLNGFIHEKKASIGLLLSVTHIEYPKCYFESILYNLISNALKYSRPGVPVEINVSTYRHDGRIVLSVKDNGLGIDLGKYGDRIFNFNQVFHSGHDSKGMGLFITRKQVESLGGSINVKSKENEGSEFIVTF
jgi:signal transduction histidine kinase